MWPCSPSFVAGVDSRCIVLVGLFELRSCPPVVPPPGSQGAAPSQVDMVSSCDTSRSGQSDSCSHYAFILARSCSPFCGSAPGGASCSCSRLPSSGNLSCPCLALPCGGVSCPHFALPYYAAGSNASGFAAAAFSAPLASSMLAVPLARPGMAPATGSAPPTSCASTPADSTASASVFMAAPASPRGSGSSWSSLRARPQAHMHGINLTMRTRAEVVIGLISSDICDRTSSKLQSSRLSSWQTLRSLARPHAP